MELLQLRYFCTVARMLNISRAAEHHRIPQPAMSKTISKLERELGTPLFDRVANRLQLTRAGEQFYTRVSQVLGDLDRAVELLEDREQEPAGEIKLMVLQHRSTMIRCVADFRRRYPAVTFYLDCSGGAEQGSFDFCCAEAPQGGTMDNSISLVREPLMLALAAEHPLAARETVAVTDLREENFACIAAEGSLWNITQTQCRDQGFEPRAALLCNDLHCLIKYISAGLGISVAPARSWQDFRDRDVVFRPLQPAMSRETRLFWDSRRTMSRAMELFRDHAARYFAELN
jgi:DNA-binding transcriptional LysR family regulator